MSGHGRFAISATVAATVAATVITSGALITGASAVPMKAAGTTVGLRTLKGHKVLDAGAGKFVYVHVTPKGKDVPCKTTQCLNVWPAVSTKGKPHATAGVRRHHLSETKKHGVTYYGHRLYFFKFDLLHGTSIGDDITSFGGKWKVVSAKDQMF
jgi:predicted lipoprotein with Yx(FWY)xxD motif